MKNNGFLIYYQTKTGYITQVLLYINSAACFSLITSPKKHGTTIVLFVRKQLRDTIDLSVHDSFISELN